jgi:hypothetical protein
MKFIHKIRDLVHFWTLPFYLFLSYFPCFAKKYKILYFLLNNLNSSEVNHLKFIHKVKDHKGKPILILNFTFYFLSGVMPLDLLKINLNLSSASYLKFIKKKIHKFGYIIPYMIQELCPLIYKNVNFLFLLYL